MAVLSVSAFSQQTGQGPGGGSSGASGTVNPNNGTAGAQAFYPAAGGSTTVGPDSLLTDNGTTLTYSGTGGITLAGATSGSAAITVTTTGGTLIFPAGSTTNPSQQYSGNASNTGWIANGVGGTNWISSGTATVLLGANGGAVQNSGTWGFNRSGSREAGLGDCGAATGAACLSIDAGSIAGEGGLLRSANPCRISADINLPTVNTPANICSFSLTGSTKVWSYFCDVQWVITAGTGTNTFSLGVNASQTPAGTTNVMGLVYTASATAPTYSSAALSASGALSVVTGPTYTPSATLQYAHLSGTLNPSATAGTFVITATANGTTETAAVKSGTMCWIW